MNFRLCALLSLLALIFMAAISLTLGSVPLNPSVMEKDLILSIILNFRAPRVILCVLCGAALAASGASFQMFFQNDLADPSITGVTAAGVFGSVLSATILKTQFVPLFSLGLCFLVTLFLSLVALRTSSGTLLLVGVAVGSLFSALSSALLIARPQNIYSVYTAILGTFSGSAWKEVRIIAAPMVLSIIFLLALAPTLTFFISGPFIARTLGVKVKTLSFLLLFTVSLALSFSTFVCGAVGFVGLIVPHLVKRSFPRFSSGFPLTFLSAVWGATFLSLCDTLARIVLAPAELPVGIITALFGAPFFLFLSLRGNTST